MLTPVYTQFPIYCDSGTTALNVVSIVSGILHTVTISSQSAAVTQGSVTLKDAIRTIQVWGAGTAAETFTFDGSYAQPLTVQNSSASDFVSISAGPV